MRISRTTLGRDNAQLAKALNNLGQVLVSQGKFDGGRPFLERSGVTSLSHCKAGNAKAAVLPVPVCAHPSRSRPSNNDGIAWAWMGAGVV